MSDDRSRFWKNNSVEMRAAGFDPQRTAALDAVVTIANPYTNAHRCNNRVRQVADLLIDTLAARNAQGPGGRHAGGVGRAHPGNRGGRLQPGVAGSHRRLC